MAVRTYGIVTVNAGVSAGIAEAEAGNSHVVCSGNGADHRVSCLVLRIAKGLSGSDHRREDVYCVTLRICGCPRVACSVIGGNAGVYGFVAVGCQVGAGDADAEAVVGLDQTCVAMAVHAQGDGVSYTRIAACCACDRYVSARLCDVYDVVGSDVGVKSDGGNRGCGVYSVTLHICGCPRVAGSVVGGDACVYGFVAVGCQVGAGDADAEAVVGLDQTCVAMAVHAQGDGVSYTRIAACCACDRYVSARLCDVYDVVGSDVGVKSDGGNRGCGVKREGGDSRGGVAGQVSDANRQGVNPFDRRKAAAPTVAAVGAELDRRAAFHSGQGKSTEVGNMVDVAAAGIITQRHVRRSR